MSLVVRDFIYLDIDRLKSIIAQLEQGLLSSTVQSTSSSKGTDASVEGGLAGFLKGTIGADFLWQKQLTETRTLHDNIYNRVEEILVKNDLLIQIPGDITPKEAASGYYSETLSDTAFFLAKGQININDFNNMQTMLERFNELGKFLAYASSESLPETISKTKRNELIRQKKQQLSLDKRMIDGFKLVFDLFYRDRVVIKMLPYPDAPDFRLVGNINEDYLRDEISSIIYKYGTAPVSEWYVFGQVASIPPQDRITEPPSMTGSQIELALQNLFEAYRGIELMAQSVVFPEIAVTPITVYRE